MGAAREQRGAECESHPIAPVAPASAGLHINVVADANNINAPARWATAVQSAASIMEQNCSDPVTINLRYGYASFNAVGRISLHYMPGTLPVIEGMYRYDAAGDFNKLPFR